jgi:hypothetical protein
MFARNLFRLVPALVVTSVLAGSEMARAQTPPGTRSATIWNYTGRNFSYDRATRVGLGGPQSDYDTRSLAAGGQAAGLVEFWGPGQLPIIRWNNGLGLVEQTIDPDAVYRFEYDATGRINLNRQP